MISFFQSIGRAIISAVSSAGFSVVVLLLAIYHIKGIFFKWRDVLRQMYIAGVKSFLVVNISALFTGMILALQTGIELRRFNQEPLVGSIVVASLTREMGPFMTALILAASVGSAMAAEIGTMKVSEEIDALEVMAIDPIKFLVMPRIVGFSLMLPILTIYANLIGTLGGAIVCKTQFGVSFELYLKNAVKSLHFKAVYVGLLKSFIFGITIATIGCSQGLRAKNGAMGVGIATRSSVVLSYIMIIILGYIITALFYR
jgi:phospholipid/cholesterol/gamma-HCH transport system permease protein